LARLGWQQHGLSPLSATLEEALQQQQDADDRD